MKKMPLTTPEIQAILRGTAEAIKDAAANIPEIDLLTKGFTTSYQNMVYAGELEYVAIMLDSATPKELMKDIPKLIGLKTGVLQEKNDIQSYDVCLTIQAEIIGLRLALTIVKEKSK